MDILSLSTSIGDVPKIGLVYQRRLKKFGIKTIQDILFHFPSRYDDFSDIIKISQALQKLAKTVCVQGKITKIKDVIVGETITVTGTITSIRNQATKTGRLMQIGQIEDNTGKITVAWFSQPFLTKMLFYKCPTGARF